MIDAGAVLEMIAAEIAAGAQAVVAADPGRGGSRLDEGVGAVVDGHQRGRRLVVVVALLEEQHPALEHEPLRELVGGGEVLDEDVARVLDSRGVRFAQVRAVGFQEDRKLFVESEAHDQTQTPDEQIVRRIVGPGDVRRLGLHLAEQTDLERRLLVFRAPLQLGRGGMRRAEQCDRQEDCQCDCLASRAHQGSFLAASGRKRKVRLMAGL